MIELYEITHHIMSSQESRRSNFAEKLGLPYLYRNNDYAGTAIKLDDCLSKWDQGLPKSMTEQGVTDDGSSSQGLILRLR